jgi:hypothetical protein
MKKIKNNKYSRNYSIAKILLLAPFLVSANNSPSEFESILPQKPIYYNSSIDIYSISS